MSEFEVRDKEGFAAKLRSTLRHGLPNLQIKAPDDHSRTSSDGRTTKDATTEIFMLTKKTRGQLSIYPAIFYSHPFSELHENLSTIESNITHIIQVYYRLKQ